MKIGKHGEKHDITLFLLRSADATLDNPQNSKAWYYKGVALSELDKLDEAQKAFVKVKEIDSKDWYNKGVALGKLGKFDEAIKAYDKAIEIDPQHSNAWYNKGLALTNLNRPNEALEAFDKANRDI